MKSHADAVIDSPIGKLGLRFHGDALSELIFLPEHTALKQCEYAANVTAQLQAYFNNSQHVFDLNLQTCGTAFQKRVWTALRTIPSGTTITYGELAKQLDSSPRAVGQACRRNSIPVIIPCHRVIGAKQLGGYAGEISGGIVAIKQWLLRHETVKHEW